MWLLKSASSLVAGVHENLVGDGRVTSLGDQRWLRRAADLDLYRLLELAARPEQGADAPEPVQEARQLLLDRLAERLHR